MTVKQLIKKLEALPPSAQVIMVTNSGAQPNASPLDAVQEDYYRPDSTWAGDVRAGEDREPGDKACVSLWPVN